MLDIPPIYLGVNCLSFVSKAKSLGIVMNSKLEASDHINSVVSKIYFVLRNLRLSSVFTPNDTKKQLVKQLILPLITYSESIYCKLDSISLHKILVAFNYATRYVYGINRFDHVSEWSKELLGCNLTTHLNMRNLCFLHNLIINKSPSYLYEKLQFSQSKRSFMLIIPKHNLLNTTRFFFIHTIKLWNSLPSHIKRICNQDKFKTEIAEHFKSN